MVRIAGGELLLAVALVTLGCSSRSSAEGSAGASGSGGSLGGAAGQGGAGATGGVAGQAGASGGMGGTAATGGSAGSQPCGSGATCLPTPPSNWSGPMLAWTGPVTATAPSCAAAGLVDAMTLYSDATTWPAATCTKCSCGTASGSVDCLAHLPSGDASCAGKIVTVGQTCESTTGLSGVSHVGKPTSFTATPSSGASCAPSGGAPTKPPPSAGTRLVACSAAGTCSDEQVCVPEPSGDLTDVCIFRPGSWTCPSDYPSGTHLQELKDNRGCAPCTCSAPSGATCTGKVVKYATSNCTALTGNLNSACEPKSAELRLEAVNTTPASCSAGGGKPSGSVALVQDYTVCCK